MKLRINAKDFGNAIAWVISRFDARDGQAYMAITVENTGHVHLTYANSTSLFKSPLAALEVDFSEEETDESYSIPVDGTYLKNFASVVKTIGAEELLFTKDLTKPGPLKVKADKQNLTVPVFLTSVPAEPKLITLGEVNDQEFFGTLQRLAKVCTSESEDTGAATGAVAVKLGEENLSFLATDTYTIAETTLSYEPNAKKIAKFKENATNDETALIPKAAALTVKPSKVATDTVELVYEKEAGKFGYSFTDGRVALFSLDSSTPLDITSLKENLLEINESSVDLPLGELTRYLTSIGILNPSETDVEIEIGQKKVQIRDVQNANVMSLKPSASDFSDGETFTFFREVLLKSLSVLTSDAVRIFFGASPGVVIRPLDSDDLDENFFVVAAVNA